MAHFVWIAVDANEAGEPAAQVWFSELAEPGDAKLLEKIAALQLWASAEAGQGEALELAQQVEGELGGWTAPVGDAQALVAAIDYGVITRGEEPFMLKYYARYASAAGEAIASRAPAAARRTGSQLVDGDKIVLTVTCAKAPRWPMRKWSCSTPSATIRSTADHR